METLAIYLLKMLICSGILFGYYRWALYNERFHQWNRFYLLAAMVLSVVVPFVNIPLFTEQPQVVTMVGAMPWNVIVAMAPAEERITWQDMLWYAALLASVVLLLRILYSVVRLLLAYRQNPVSNLNSSVRLIVTALHNAPFSFFNWLFWRKDIDPASANGQRMLAHELTHIKEGHSYDKLFTELLLCVFWMNPFFWLMRRELSMIHEFLADRKAIDRNDGAAFAGMILQAMNVQPSNPLTNPFFSSQIKRRLLMITTSKQPQYSYLRRISGLGLMIGSAIILTLTVQEVQAQKKEDQKKEADKKKPAAPATKKVAADTLLWIKDSSGKAVEKGSTITLQDGSVQLSADKVNLTSGAVEISNSGGKFTTGGLILRGVSDPTKQPLFILNGTPISEGEMKALNPNDIESITVLKDASARAMYGEKAENGVILVVTKAGAAANSENKTLKEVVVQGYASPKKVEGVPLQGKVEGLRLEKSTDTTMKMKEVTVVGYSSRKATDPIPMYVLDGKKISVDDLKSMKADEIKAINVLKGEDAIKKYGDDGKNGVIEIISAKHELSIVFTKTEKMPSFPGGADGWSRYLERNLSYPDQAHVTNTQGVAKVQFVVDEGGNLSNFKILKDPGAGLGEEAVRVIKKGPKWEPAEQNGKKVTARIEQNVTFQLQQ